MTNETIRPNEGDGSVPSLVSVTWLHDRLTSANLLVVDATMFLPGVERNARAEYEDAHIPGAVFLEMESISDPDSTLPNAMPTSAHFEKTIGELGISDEDSVVVYDTHGIMSSPRVWWMFRAFGHQNVAVLDGGLPKWQREGLPVETGTPTYEPKDYKAVDPSHSIRTMEQVDDALGKGIQIVDARATSRFEGLQPEPRPRLRSGHIPGSRNVPYTTLLDPKEGTLLPPAQLAEKFQAADVDTRLPVIFTCGSGVSACVLALAFSAMGADDIPVYDGSWTEWGSNVDKAVATGPYKKSNKH